MPKRTTRNPDHVQRHNRPSPNNEAIARSAVRSAQSLLKLLISQALHCSCLWLH